MKYLMTFVWVWLLCYATIPLFWLIVHPFAATWRSRKGKIYPLLGFLWLLIIVAAGLVTAQFRHRYLYSTPWAWIAGLLFVMLGFSMYRALTRSDRMSRDTIMGRPELRPEENEQKLITTGLHGVIRHPIYVGHFLVLTGLVIVSGTIAAAGLWVFAIITGVLMIRTEEKELEARFGEAYREYKHRVPAFLPNRSQL